ncbi:TonB-dependent receptor [Brevundimonas sp. SORGH_AS_0993]|uniref:TonB-dependent receptor domain-containing protein n=1 Tax=Brevundimonas sp. SORGH_AS_0993 TaxID=3041794 RepID=UPI002787A7C2|nr:TonB-dependent receptor [Brevundimonas sp. SORGH_AS_0993]MDQ1153407.1 iron complex outermembrane receptor protein [Brevundimonas sp. SORGH_AS_0993]
MRLAAGLAAGLVLCLPDRSHAEVRHFSIPALPTARALPIFARQAGIQVLAPSEGLGRARSPALNGPLDARVALARLIDGSGLEVASDDGRIILLRPVSESREPPVRLVDGEPALVDEVVVTALRRETTASRTPISLVVIDADDPGASGLSSLSQLGGLAPGLIQTELNTGQRRLSLRGVQSAGENSVALYIGDTPVSGPNSATSDPSSITPDLSLFDTQRLEVLKGPQGTLFGSGAMSGAVRILYNRPDLERSDIRLQSSWAAAAGGGSAGSVAALVNAPVSDTFGGRLAVWSEGVPGYIDNPRLRLEDVNAARKTGARAALRWLPGAGAVYDATVIVQEQKVEDSAITDPALGGRRLGSYARLPFPNRFRLGALTVEQAMPSARLTASLSHYDWRATKYIDTSLSALTARRNGLYCPRYVGVSTTCDADQLAAYQAYVDSILPVVGYQPMEVSSTVAEARLDSAPNPLLNWTLGVFRENRRDYSVSSTVLATVEGGVARPLTTVFTRSTGVDLIQTALYGEFALSPWSNLTLRLGARRYEYDKISRAQVLQTSYLNASVQGPEAVNHNHESGWVRRATAAYRFNAHAMVFAQYAEGFRPGGANNTPGLADAYVAYRPDGVRNFELGLKTTAGNGRLLIDAAVFQVLWSDMQVAARIPNFNFITNAGEAAIRGFEVEGRLGLTSNLRVRWSLSHTDARLTKASTSTTFDVAGKVGDRIPYEPDLRASAALIGTFRLPRDLELSPRIEFVHRGYAGSVFDRLDPYYEHLPASTLVNAGIDLKSGAGALGLQITNALNSNGVTWAASRAEYERYVVAYAPRTLQLTLRHIF